MESSEIDVKLGNRFNNGNCESNILNADKSELDNPVEFRVCTSLLNNKEIIVHTKNETAQARHGENFTQSKSLKKKFTGNKSRSFNEKSNNSIKQSRGNVDHEKTYVPKMKHSPGPSKNIDHEKIYGHKQRNLSRPSRNVNHENIYDQKQRNLPEAGRNVEQGKKNNKKQINANSPSKNEQGNQNVSKTSTFKQMNFKYLQDLFKEEISDSIIVLANAKSGFLTLFDSKLRPDWLILVMAILSKVCSSDLIHLRLSILSEACNHVFLDELQKYIATISTETDKTRKTQIESFFNNTFVFCNTLYEVIPNTAKERLKKLLYTVCIVLNYIRENECKILEEHILVNLISSFSQLNSRTPNLKEQEVNIEKSQECPPDDFRCINILPTYDDMFSENPFLRRNIVKGSYSDIQSYLDIQFRLFREDFIAPLRDGIREYITVLMNPGKKNRMKSIKTYYNVHFKSCASNKNGFGFDVDFNAEYLKNIKWEHSKRFMFGSLLLISNDDFKTFNTVTVLEREIESLKKGIVTVAFPYGAEIPDNIFDNSYVMLESVVYFEPYFRVLTALQAVKEDNFPMEKYIISVESEIDIPKYLRDSSEDNGMEEDICTLKDLLFYNSDSKAEDHEESVEHTICQTKVMNKKYPVHQWIINKFKVDNILDEECWPSQDNLKLDPSQYSAFKAALTSEFCVIQGPPGTGKTFIGLKIVEALLKNVKFKSNPIMIICYTNHALDQFLEGILSFTDNLIRIGGQSKNEKLEKYNLKNLRRTKEKDKPERQTRYLSRNLREILEDIAINISMLERKYKSLNYYGILKMNILQKFMSLEEQTKLGGGVLAEWLLEDVLMGESIHYICRNDDNDDTVYIYQGKMKKNEKEVEKREELLTIDELDIDEENALRQQEAEVDPLNVNFRINLNTTWKSQFIAFDRQIQHIDNELERLNFICTRTEENTTLSTEVKNRKLYFLSRSIQQLKSDKCKEEARLNIVYNYLVEKLSSKADFDPNILKEFKKIKNIWALDINKRWALYNYWKTKYGNVLMNNIKILEKKYRKYCFMLEECRQIDDLAFVKNAKVIGMTTTNSARLHSMLQKLKPKIVIVEEAAEVFEAHIVTALAKDCEHVILIGDHKQLRPSPNMFKLAKDYNLDISLFERMVNNGMSCHTLAVQHRMRPEFASLIVPTIYPELQNHPSVEGRPDIKGVASNMYFIKHTIPEDQVEDSSSRCNKYEADFLISLCCYLIYQGYKPEEITILAPYTGQMYYMFKKRKEKPIMKDVRITVVDNFQGEENKIILLCLVRSNAEARIGFLGTSNRVCVSLSRAKEGLYIIGNMENLTQSSGMWNDINMQLEKLNVVGPALPLRCEYHKHHITRVSRDLDFSQVRQGCCSLDCGFKMNCGHICTKMCHLNDREHVENKCLEYCMKKKCQFEEHNYKCDKLCWEECLLCVTIVNHNLACGHEIVLPCHEIESYKCIEEVEQLLLCGHSKIIKCHLDPSEEICEKVIEQKLKCGHNKSLKCCVNVDEYKCQELIQHELSCGHSAMIPCCQDPKQFICKTLEKYTFPLCKHVVNKPCYMKEVKQRQCPHPCMDRLECGHACSNNCHKDEDPDHILYTCTKACTRKKKNCSMNHGCDKLCFEKCHKCDVKVVKELPCGHESEVLCSTDVKFVHCKMPCDKILKCSHSVNVECSTDLTLLICNEECVKKLPCGHIAFVKCSENVIFTHCMEVVEKTLPKCGHKQQTKCHEEPQLCQEIIHKDDVQTDCGHANIALPCSIYQSINNIPISIPLSKNVKSYCLKQFCQEPCNKQLSCGHTCVGLCGSCLQGNIHVPCSEICNKVLVCGHKCNALCKEICPPCNQNCLNTCQHGDCGRKCGETCKPCTKKCDWECPHKRCTRLCSQMCDCDPCNEPCPKKLKCQHPCMGFCGEVCPPLCWSCDNLQSKYKENDRLVQLEDCEHIVESWKLETAINTSIKEQQIVLKVCPICASPINKTKRYRNNTRITYRMIQAVKKEVLYEFRNMYNKIDFLKQKLSSTSSIKILQPVVELVNNILNESKPSKQPHEYYSVVMISEWLIELRLFFTNMDRCLFFYKQNKRNDLVVKELIENRIVALLKSMQFYLHCLNFEVMNRIGLEIVRIQKMINYLFKHNQTLINDEAFDILFSNCDYTLQVHTIISDKLKERDKHLKTVPSSNKNVNLNANMWYHCLDDHVYSVLPSCGKTCSKCNNPRKIKTSGIDESIVRFHRDQYNADTGKDASRNRFQRDRFNAERGNNKRFPIGRRDEGLQFYTRNDNVRGMNYRVDERVDLLPNVKDKTLIGSLNMTGVEHRHSKEGRNQHRLNCMQSVMRREIIPPNYRAHKSGPFVTERDSQQHLRYSVPIHKEMNGTHFQRTSGLQIPQNKIPSLLNIKFEKPPIQPEVSSSVVTDNQHQSKRRQHLKKKKN